MSLISSCVIRVNPIRGGDDDDEEEDAKPGNRVFFGFHDDDEGKDGNELCFDSLSSGLLFGCGGRSWVMV